MFIGSESESNDLSWSNFSMGHMGASRKSPNDVRSVTLSDSVSYTLRTPYTGQNLKVEGSHRFTDMQLVYAMFKGLSYRRGLTHFRSCLFYS